LPRVPGAGPRRWHLSDLRRAAGRSDSVSAIGDIVVQPLMLNDNVNPTST